MKTFSRVLTQLAGVVAVCTAPVFAQNSLNLTANVPFAFNVGGKLLPAGTYQFQCVAGTPRLTIRTAGGIGVVMIPTNNDHEFSAPRKSEVVFHVYGTKRYFAGAWTSGVETGRLALKTAAEKESERAGIPMRLAALQASSH